VVTGSTPFLIFGAFDKAAKVKQAGTRPGVKEEAVE